MKNLNLLLSAFCLLLTLAASAWAERADRDKPIEIEADSLTSNDAKKTSTYTGNVIVTQGTLQIRADRLVVREDSEGFQHSTSYGDPTTFRQKMEGKDEYISGSGRRIEYNGRMDKVQIYEKAWVKRGNDTVHGEYIMYDAGSEFAEVIGGPKTASDSQGRVRATIQPKSKKGAGGSADAVAPVTE